MKCRKIPEFENEYVVSKDGDVFRKVGDGHRKISPSTNDDGYKTVVLYKDGKPKFKYIHDLVAAAWMDNPDGKKLVNHEDGDKSNDSLDNLEYATNGENTQHAYKHGLAKGPKGEVNGKALSLDTVLPTPNGWTTMGSIRVDDKLFDDNGNICNVVGTTDILIGRPCYEVRFSDGSVIVADENHLWETRTNKPKFKTGLFSTLEILNTLKVHKKRLNNHRIKVSPALQLPEAALSIHPYVLGVWLGDGHSAQGYLTYAERDAEILELVRECGETAFRIYTKPGTTNSLARLGSWKDKHSRRSSSLKCKLRGLGTLNNKHIPPQYLRASYTQRLALLQGLMDTDGSIYYTGKRNAKRRTTECEFSNTNPALAHAVRELVISLGLKASISVGRSIRGGKHYDGISKDCGLKYRVLFCAFRDTPIFRLSRKLIRQIDAPIIQSSTSKHRYIIDVQTVPSVPVKCIEVDSVSGLYLAGPAMIMTHNSKLTKKQVAAIRKSDKTGVKLAQMYKVDPAAISLIKSGDRW